MIVQSAAVQWTQLRDTLDRLYREGALVLSVTPFEFRQDETMSAALTGGAVGMKFTVAEYRVLYVPAEKR